MADSAHWRDRLSTLMTEHSVPGAALGILRDGQIVDVAAGVLSTATSVEARPNDVFHLGSITKVWTATLIMQLVDEGEITLDTPVVEALPEFSNPDRVSRAGITVRHLLNHTSGLDDVYADTGDGDDCIARYVAELRDLPDVRPAGEIFSYCNTGIVLAGRIVEVITGRPWNAALRERLIDPLALTATITRPQEAVLHRVAVGHPGGLRADSGPTAVWSGPRCLGPTGRISARVHDLLVFARMHLSGGIGPDGRRLLSAASARAMAGDEVALAGPSPMGGSWGLGWARDRWDGRPVIGHDGTGIGQLAFLRMLPEQDFAVALLTNGGDGHGLYRDVFAEIFDELARVGMPAPFEPPAEPVGFDVAPYAGRYHARADCDVEVLEGDQGLVLRSVVSGTLSDFYPSISGEFPLIPVAEDRFAMRRPESAEWESVFFAAMPDGTPCLYQQGLIACPTR